VAPHSYAISPGQEESGSPTVTANTFPLKHRSIRRRARESCGVAVTSAMVRQPYFLARRPTNSASPRVLAGLGSKHISLTAGTGGGHGPPYPSLPLETTRTFALCSRARRTAAVSRGPGPASMTIAFTCDGIPVAGQIKSRAVSAQNRTTTSMAALNTRRRHLAVSISPRRPILLTDMPCGRRPAWHAFWRQPTSGRPPGPYRDLDVLRAGSTADTEAMLTSTQRCSPTAQS
jgi:hypothetical protein